MMHTTARPPWSSMSLQYPRPPLHISLWALACTRPQIAPLERHVGQQANERPSRHPHSLAASSPAIISPSAYARAAVHALPLGIRLHRGRRLLVHPPFSTQLRCVFVRHGGILDGWPRSAPRQRLREVIRPSGRAGPDAISALAVQHPAAPTARPLNALPSPPPLHLHHHHPPSARCLLSLADMPWLLRP